MKMHAYVAGVGMTRFGKHLDVKLKHLAGEAIREALADAGIASSEIQAAYMGNAAAGVLQGQEMIRGQAVLREMGIGRIPVVNVENACATSSTAFHQACAMVTFGAYDVVLVCGYEKLFNADKMKSFLAFDGAVDTENPDGLNGALKLLAAEAGEVVDVQLGDKSRSVFMDIYAYMSKAHMRKYGTTREQIAAVTAKNSRHWRAESAGAVPDGDDRRGSACRARNRLAADAADVLAHWRWRRRAGDRERTEGEGHGPVAARARAVLGAGLGFRRRRGQAARWVPSP